MEDRKLFENWYAANVSDSDRTRMLETNKTGNYKLMQANNDYSAFIAGISAFKKDAVRYRFLRDRDLETTNNGGVFAGIVPENVVVNGADLDDAIDNAMQI